MASIADISRQIRTQSKINWQAVTAMDGAYLAGHGNLFRDLDCRRATACHWCNYMKLIHWNSINVFIFQSPRSQMSKDSFSNSAAIIGGITRWPSARFCFCCGAFESATMFATPSHYTTRPNWFPTQSTTSRWWICWWWQYSKCIQNSKDCERLHDKFIFFSLVTLLKITLSGSEQQNVKK